MTFDDMDEGTRQFLQHVLRQFAGNSSLAPVGSLIED
jgi:hypothetical protein